MTFLVETRTYIQKPELFKILELKPEIYLAFFIGDKKLLIVRYIIKVDLFSKL